MNELIIMFPNYNTEVNKMTKNEEWQEATSGKVVKLEEGERIEGKYMLMEPSVTYPESYALHLDVAGKNTVIFVNKIVHDLIETNDIKRLQEISLLYVGKRKTIDGKKEYNDYKLFYK